MIIEDIEVAPEGASAYYNIEYDKRIDIGNKQLIMLDIGGRTTDVSMFINKKISDIKTISVGMLNVYQDIIDTINTEYTENFTLEDGELILRNYFKDELKSTTLAEVKKDNYVNEDVNVLDF